MRNYGRNLTITGLLIRGVIAIVLIVVGILLFRSIFTIVATLLTMAIIGLGIYFIFRWFDSRTRY
jgi:hypothetical protein